MGALRQLRLNTYAYSTFVHLDHFSPRRISFRRWTRPWRRDPSCPSILLYFQGATIMRPVLGPLATIFLAVFLIAFALAGFGFPLGVIGILILLGK